MNMLRFTIKMLVIATFMFAFASLAQAQATRTWVSGVGDDANPCSRTAPCKTFAGAISKTAPCGEIDVIDPGGFGQVTITKSLTIDGTGTMASILAAAGNAININAAGTDTITIRGISINGSCLATNGISITQAKAVNVENCVIFKFTQNGITNSDSTGLAVNVRDTSIHDNTGDGVNFVSTATVVNASLMNSSFNGNANGIHARGGSRVVARSCVFSNNSSNGVFSDGAVGGSIASARVWDSIISANTQGVLAGLAANAGISRLEIGQNQIVFNTGNGVVISTGGVVDSFGNNSILDNGGNGCGGCSSVAPGA